MYSSTLIAGRWPARIMPLSTAALLTLSCFLFLPSSWADEPATKVSFQQLMGERNSRIQQLTQSNGDIFQKILDAQASDRASLKKSNLTSEQRREKEIQINQHYSKTMKALDVGKKEVEADIYGVWKESSTRLQNGTALDNDRWESIDDVVNNFEESFFAGSSEANELDPQQQVLAEHLKTCSPLEQQFEHPFTGDSLTRSVKGFSDENCHYVEEMPANGRLECYYPKDKLPQIADFYLYPERFESAEIKSHTEFVDGDPVTTTEYIVDGKAVFHPLNDSMENGECKVLGYN